MGSQRVRHDWATELNWKHCGGFGKRPSSPQDGDILATYVGLDTGLWWNILIFPAAPLLSHPCPLRCDLRGPLLQNKVCSLACWLWAWPYDSLCLANGMWANVTYSMSQPLVVVSFFFLSAMRLTCPKQHHLGGFYFGCSFEYLGSTHPH